MLFTQCVTNENPVIVLNQCASKSCANGVALLLTCKASNFPPEAAIVILTPGS